MFHLNPDHLALVRALRQMLPTAAFLPERGPTLVASVPSLGLEGQVVARVERSPEGGRRIVFLVGQAAGG